MRVTLSQHELETVEEVGRRRQAYAVGRNLPSEFGRKEGRSVDNHVIGCLGEFATAKALSLPWIHNVGTITAPDVGVSIEVRTRLLPGGVDLVLISRDKPKIESVFVLCHARLNRSGSRVDLTVDVVGWITGRQGMRRAYWQDAKRYAPKGACFIPPADLCSMDELDAAFERLHHERRHPLSG